MVVLVAACSGSSGGDSPPLEQPSGLSAPAAPLASATSPASVELSWDLIANPPPGLNFWIQRDGALIGFTQEYSFVDVGLTPGTSYDYALVLQDSSGLFAVPSPNTAVSTPMDLTPPIPPTNFTAIVTRFQSGQIGVVLEWSPATDDGFVADYLIRRDGTTIGSTNATVWVDATPLAGVQHCYEIIPVDTAGNQPPSGPSACVDTGWELLSTTVGSALGRGAAIAVGSADDIDIFHGDSPSLGLGSGLVMHSQWDGALWMSQPLSLPWLVESNFDVERDVLGDLHLVGLRRNPNLGLVYAHRKDGVWNPQLIDDQALSGLDAEVSVSSTGVVHVAHANLPGAVRYLVGENGNFEITPASAQQTVARGAAICLTDDLTPHVFFGFTLTSQLNHAWFDGNEWRLEVVAPGVNVDQPIAAVADPDGTLHVVWESVLGRVRHAEGVSGGTWSLESISPITSIAAKPDITRTPAGELHVGYFDPIRGAVIHATRVGGVWQTTIVDDDPDVSARLTIDAGDDGTVGMAYRAGGSLRLARQL